MHATRVCHNIMDDALNWMHQVRLKSLKASIVAAISEKRSTVTGLGRAIESEA